MPADRAFFDTSYLVRLYLEDFGFEAVRDLTRRSQAVAAAWHAQAELLTALHRAFRERGLPSAAYQAMLRQFATDRESGLYTWHPLDASVLKRVEKVLASAPTTLFLRAADALHLACAAEQGFAQVYSNDRHFLAAAPYFGIQGTDVIPPRG